ncbi:MAG: HAD-IA family hydrolase [Clostridia bacterium]|nr:HAD-IA family hydrolase [Clostridia bacterium]
MKYKAYIFDLDGTLLDTLLDLANAVNFAMREKGYPERTVAEVRNFIGNGIKVLIKRSVPDGTSEDDYAEALELFTKYYLEHIADYTKPYDGMIDVVKTLTERGCKVAVLSNKAHVAAQAVVKDFFGDIFDIVVGKMDEFPSKPEPDSLFYTIRTLGVTAEECVYIGDSDVDVLTAHNAGLPCIGVTWGNRDEDVLIASGAEYIANTPNEILNI